ncbi:anti-anti-sigma factor [Moorena bouillonii PNG]|uniref:Anti-anti-sigma factor n=2 Tax=Moorena TaxID=1155738 RepID=A0A1U7N5W2_9CYAN|nr:anti-anti-sigma factor [Moorena bouillonii PNG]
MMQSRLKTSSQAGLINEAAVVQLPIRLSRLEAIKFKETCDQLLQQPYCPKRIIADFSQTDFIDSSGIGALVRNHKITQENGVSLILRGINPPVMAVLVMTGLDKKLILDPSYNPTTIAVNWSKAKLPTTHPSTRSWAKRCLDILGGIVGLGITAILFIPIAIAIKLDSPGPIFFSQIRCGWMGKGFRIWKFRSMYTDAEAQKDSVQNQSKDAKIFKNENDPRITRVGRFLRKTSLDELPQFWNVIKGEMSLVGTRPPVPKEVDIYEVPEWQRLNVKPGMTGEWQVHGRSQVRDFADIIKLDLRYQRNWSLMYDLKLIIKTLFILLSKNNGAV